HQFFIFFRKIRSQDKEVTNVFMGPLVSAEHLEKVRHYVDLAVKEGATIECFSGGYFLQPTIITGLQDSSPVNREEIFGPVVVMSPFSSMEEVVQRANDVDYGLCAVVFTKDINLAHRTAGALEVGTVWVNSWLVRDLTMPFGGMKKSGLGREGLLHSMETFTEEKTHCIQLSH
ncbi:Aldehyde dehydrogenase family 8 member A1like, partial [Caligus rogercresseyi]